MIRLLLWLLSVLGLVLAFLGILAAIFVAASNPDSLITLFAAACAAWICFRAFARLVIVVFFWSIYAAPHDAQRPS